MADVILDVGDDLTGIGFVPAPVQFFGHDPELDDEVAGEVLRLSLAMPIRRACRTVVWLKLAKRDRSNPVRRQVIFLISSRDRRMSSPACRRSAIASRV
jgi:hypothetical protein